MLFYEGALNRAKNQTKRMTSKNSQLSTKVIILVMRFLTKNTLTRNLTHRPLKLHTKLPIRIISVWGGQGQPNWRVSMSENWWGCVFDTGLSTTPSFVCWNWELRVCVCTCYGSTVHMKNNKQFFASVYFLSHFCCNWSFGKKINRERISWLFINIYIGRPNEHINISA